ncbi:MAG: FlgO family outer membrane protein [Spirosomataceae bacterium]
MKQVQTLLLMITTMLPYFSYAQESDIDTKMEKMATQLSERIRTAGKSRIAVTDFTDLQGNVTELGKYLAENFQGALVNQQLRVVNRQRLSQLLTENKLTAQGLLDPTNSLKIGKAAGMEVIIVGTVAPIDERTIAINVLALDVQGAEAIASAKTALVRTSSMNDLLRTNVTNGSSSTQETSTLSTTNTGNQDVSYTLMGDKSIEMKKESCTDEGYYYGQICFENTLKQPLVLYYVTGFSNYYPNMLIGVGTRNCTEKLRMAYRQSDVRTTSLNFYFHTPEEDEGKRLYGKMTVEVEACKVKTRVINSNRLFLSKTKPY